ncbi:Hypothetical predicted protein [Xyrichtys novacula]|uniref:Uncharacterized protein n=1 Tax=Xyrichtys novacula TaxID=13765 RepID=A0AAV1GU78_XYRNO|nr:Hypothetical predicted protein [Xyrichtys novacula]
MISASVSYPAQKVTSASVCQILGVFQSRSCKPETHHLLLPRRPVSSLSFLRRQPSAEPDCSACTEEDDSETEPERTDNQVCSHLPAGTRGAVLDWKIPGLHPCFLYPRFLPPFPLRLRDCRTETSMSRCGRRSQSSRLPPLLLTTYDLQHIIPPTATDPAPF